MESSKFKLESDGNSNYFLIAHLDSSRNGKIVVLDNLGNLNSRQLLKLSKGENKIDIGRITFTDSPIHIVILYLEVEMVFRELIVDNKFLHK